jgi:hypothetical protein
MTVPGTTAEGRILARPTAYLVFSNTGDHRLILTCTGPGGREVVDSTEVLWNEAAYAYAKAYNEALDRWRR